MSSEPSYHGPAASRKFFPDVKPLESRLLLSQSQKVSFPDGSSFVFPLFMHLPRTGGASAQTGTVLGIGVGQPKTNTVQVTADGEGNVQAEWNGGPVHSLTGIKSTVIETERARTNQITFNLTGQRTSPTAVAVGSNVPTDAAIARAGGHPLNVRIRRTSGVAVQSGSVLSVTVNKPTADTVEISNDSGGAVEVEWNGGAVHSFTGVATIVVDTRNATKDLVALDDATG
jgi:Bacterial cellulose synthase subunit